MECKIEFSVNKVIYRDDLFAEIMANKIKITDNNNEIKKIYKKDLRKQMKIKGDFPFSLDIEDKFEAIVELKIDKRDYSPYLDIVKDLRRVGLEKAESLAKFLRTKINVAPKENDKLSKWKLLKPVSEKIVQYIGLDAIQKIIDNPTELLLFDDLKLNDDKIFEMQRILSRNADLQKISVILGTSNLEMNTILSLYDMYGEKIISIIKANPYQICYDGQISFKIADKLAYDARFDMYNEIRVKTGIIEFLKYMLLNGNICILKEQIFNPLVKGHKNLNQFLNTYGTFKNNNIPNDLIEQEIQNLIKENKLVIEKDYNTEYIYLPQIHLVEEQLIDKLKYLLTNTYNRKFCDESDIDVFLNNYEQRTSMYLDSLQKQAVKNTINNKVSILTGGPGTGKTATVNVIYQAIEEISKIKYNREPIIVLLAPTGKAAERMTELTHKEASTIHRKLDVIFEDDIPAEIIADYVIVDEASMIDIYLMKQLLSALSEETRILFVGDINQLPSVGPGKILQEFISCNKIPFVHLKTIFRQAQGSEIVNNANKIILGKTSTMNDGIILDNDPNKNFKFIKGTTTKDVQQKILNKVDELLNHSIKLSDICVLTAMRKGELGVENLNTLFQEKYNPNPIVLEDEENGYAFKIGDKVIQTKNDYELKVFNGYVGTIVDIDDNYIEDGTIHTIVVVEYDNMSNLVTYKDAKIKALELAYVLTVHKSQGSEYPYVISPIHYEQKILLNRNLLYTDVTRAKKEFCLIGDEKAVDLAISTEISDFERISRISDKIAMRV